MIQVAIKMNQAFVIVTSNINFQSKDARKSSLSFSTELIFSLIECIIEYPEFEEDLVSRLIGSHWLKRIEFIRPKLCTLYYGYQTIA